MDRHVLYGVFLSIFLPAVIIPADIYWMKWKDFREFEQYFEQTTNAVSDISTLEKETVDETYGKNVDDWRKKASSRLDRLFLIYKSENNVEIDKSIIITRKLFNELFELKTELATQLEPLFSEKMRDKKTMADLDTYEWRRKNLTEITQYLTKNDARFNQIVDTFRQSISDSSLPEKNREYIWHKWFSANKEKLKTLMPDIVSFADKVAAYSRFYEFMYSHKDGYYINNNDDVVFTNQRYTSDYRSLSQALGSG